MKYTTEQLETCPCGGTLTVYERIDRRYSAGVLLDEDADRTVSCDSCDDWEDGDHPDEVDTDLYIAIINHHLPKD